MSPYHHVVPVEVFDPIIDQASDHSCSLRAISLTCRTFLPRARYHLFHRIIIRTSEQMCSVPAFLRERPWLLPLVRVVKFDAYRGNSLYPHEIIGVVPVPLLTKLPNLCRFELYLRFDNGSLSLSRLTLCALPKYSAPVRHLELFGVRFSSIDDLMRYLSAFPNLSRLTCNRLEFEKGEIPLGADALSHYNLKLTHLVVSYSINAARLMTDAGSRGRATDERHSSSAGGCVGACLSHLA